MSLWQNMHQYLSTLHLKEHKLELSNSGTMSILWNRKKESDRLLNYIRTFIWHFILNSINLIREERCLWIELGKEEISLFLEKYFHTTVTNSTREETRLHISGSKIKSPPSPQAVLQVCNLCSSLNGSMTGSFSNA